MLNPTESNKNSIRATIFFGHTLLPLLSLFFSLFFFLSKLKTNGYIFSLRSLLFASLHSPFINFDFTRWFNLIFPKATSSRDLHVMCDLAV